VEDRFAVTIVNSILLLEGILSGTTDRAREIPLWGKLGTRLVRGIADQVERRFREAENDWSYILSDTKTVNGQYLAADKKLSGPNGFQIMLYKKLWDGMVRNGATPAGMELADEVMRAMGLDPELELSDTVVAQAALLGLDQARTFLVEVKAKELPTDASGAVIISSDSAEPDPESSAGSSALPAVSTPRTLATLMPHLLSRFGLFPVANPNLELHFYQRGASESTLGEIIPPRILSVEYDSAKLERWVANALEFWNQSRSPNGVDIEDAGWKCRLCEFSENCSWRMKKAEVGFNAGRRESRV
jgi:exonuclease V